MRRLLPLAVLLLVASGAAAQDFEIVSVEAREPTTGAAELAVTIQNNRRTASHYSVLAQIPGAATLPVHPSTERLAPGARTEVVLRFDASAHARPLAGTVEVRNHRRAVVDRAPFTLGAAPAESSRAPDVVTASTEVAMEIPPIREAEVSTVTVRVTTGADDRGAGTVVFFRLYDVDGELLTTQNAIVSGSAILATLDTPPWPAGSVQTVDVPLLEPIAPSRIDRAELAASPRPRASGTDAWDVAAVEIEAGGRVLARVSGPPFHRFSTASRDRRIQVRAPDADREVNVLKVVLHTGGDDKRARSAVRFQAFDRAGAPLNEPFENHWITHDALPGGSSRSVGWFISRVPAREIGSIVIEHESVQTGPFDTADNWSLAGVDVLVYQGSDDASLNERVFFSAMGSPLHRFDGSARRFVVRLP